MSGGLHEMPIDLRDNLIAQVWAFLIERGYAITPPGAATLAAPVAAVEAALARPPLADCEWGCDDEVRSALTDAAMSVEPVQRCYCDEATAAAVTCPIHREALT